MDRRGITEQEHRRIQALAGEGTEEADYYEVLWETGGSQSDIATLDADRIDWEQRSILYRRMKTQNRGYEFAKVRLGARLVAVLERLPRQGPLFPQLAAMSLENRARLFRRRVHALGLKNISLHCYRYAWAERARKAQVPLRVAMETLGHQSRAVHQAYAKKVEVDLMPLEYYEQKAKETIVAFQACTQPEPNSAKEPALAVSPG
jgi:integrase